MNHGYFIIERPLLNRSNWQDYVVAWATGMATARRFCKDLVAADDVPYVVTDHRGTTVWEYA